MIVRRHGAAGLGATVSKVAAGAAESVPFVSVNNLGKVLNWLKEYGVKIVGTSDVADLGAAAAGLISACFSLAYRLPLG